MQESKYIQEDWYVIFTQSKLNHWLMKYMDSYFQHCYMVKQTEGVWVIVNSKNCHTDVRMELVEDYPHIRLLCPNSVILNVRVSIDPDKYQWHLGINSCVDTCKGILGINNFWVLTPYKLYKYLRDL